MSPCCHCAASSACSCQQMHGKKQLPPVSSFLTFTVISVMRLPLGVSLYVGLFAITPLTAASSCSTAFSDTATKSARIYTSSLPLWKSLSVCTLPVSKSLLPSTNSCITSNSMPLQALYGTSSANTTVTSSGTPLGLTVSNFAI